MRVLYRADAGAAGAGHVMRGLGLAQALALQGATPELLTATPADPSVDAWRADGLAVSAIAGLAGSEADLAASSAAARAADVFVLDGYAFAPAWRAALQAEVPLAVFDDLGHGGPADLAINPNPGGEALRYDGAREVAAGVAYAPLRRDVREARVRAAARSAAPATPLAIVTFGGHDAENLALVALRALAGAPLRARAFCTGGDSALAEARAFAAHHPGLEAVPKGDLPAALAEADLALCAGGVTPLEVCAIGACAVVVVLAENQAPGAEALRAAGACDVATSVADGAERLRRWAADPGARAAMRERQRRLVDGDGARRLAERVRALAGARRGA